MNSLTIISTVFGAIGIIANTIIFWQKDRKKLLFAKLIADVVWTAHYGLLCAYTGAITCGISIIRETVFINKKRRWAQSNLWPILFVLISAVFGIVSWKNIINVLPICASILSVISFAIGKPNITRKFQLIISVLFLTYDIYVMSYAGIINEVCTLTSVAIALLFFRQKAK